MNEQKNRFTYHGTVHELGAVQNFNSGFRKREIVCRSDGGKYTDYAVFTVKNETCDKLDKLKPGDDVTVDFALDGHAWDGPKGKRWFAGATALKVEAASGANAGSRPAASAPATAADDAIAQDVPF